MSGSPAERFATRFARWVSGPAGHPLRKTRLGPRGAAGLVSRATVGAMVFVVRAYQVVVSPLLGPCCRYAPSCSAYAIEALEVHGVVRGLVLAAWRVLRCHPFAEGGYDPVPRQFRLFGRRQRRA